MSQQQMYCAYLEAQGATFEKELSTKKYQCWSIAHQESFTVQNWIGEIIGTEQHDFRLFIWLGLKGAIYVTNTPLFKKSDDKNVIIHKMKKWLWSI